jgi:hypothetical protein
MLLFGLLTQDCALLVLGYYRFPLRGKEARLTYAFYVIYSSQRPNGANASFGLLTQDCALLVLHPSTRKAHVPGTPVLGYYPLPLRGKRIRLLKEAGIACM